MKLDEDGIDGQKFDKSIVKSTQLIGEIMMKVRSRPKDLAVRVYGHRFPIQQPQVQAATAAMKLNRKLRSCNKTARSSTVARTEASTCTARSLGSEQFITLPTRE